MSGYAIPLSRATGRPLPLIAEDWEAVFVGAFTPESGGPDNIVVTASASTSDRSTVGEMRFRVGDTATPSWPVYSTPASSTILGILPHSDTSALVTVEMRRLVGAGDLFMPLAAATVINEFTVPTPPAVVYPISIDVFSIAPTSTQVGEPIAISIEASGTGSLVAQLERLLDGETEWVGVGDQTNLTAGVETVVAATPTALGTHAYRVSVASDVLDAVISPIIAVEVSPVPVYVPPKLENLTAEAQEAGDLNGGRLTWDVAADRGNPVADTYSFRYRQMNTSAWTTSESNIGTVLNGGPFTIIDPLIGDGETWEFQLRLGNAEGLGEWSDSASVAFTAATTDGRVTTTGDSRVTSTGDRRVRASNT